jgi:nitrite reductase/ring-hydroxylating ferredoxin subunit
MQTNKHFIAPSVQALPWQKNNLCIVEVQGKKITVALHNNQLHACAFKCPHASGIMADGFIDGLGNIVCPLHRYKFNVATGRNTSGEGYYLKTYSVEVSEDGVFVVM